MGYSTDFAGVLTFKNELTPEQEKKLSTFLGADCRDHPEWDRLNENEKYLSWIELEFDENGDGLIWDGAEKTYDMVEKINLILREMRKDFPDFELEGGFDAFGEIGGDIWRIGFKDGWAVYKDITLTNKTINCPHCHKDVVLEDSHLRNI